MTIGHSDSSGFTVAGRDVALDDIPVDHHHMAPDEIHRDALLLPLQGEVVGGDGCHVDAVGTQMLGCPWMKIGSGDADSAHHPRRLVLEDVAVEHPVAGVVGDEGDLDALLRRQQDGVLPFPKADRLAIAAEVDQAPENPEALSTNVVLDALGVSGRRCFTLDVDAMPNC